MIRALLLQGVRAAVRSRGLLATLTLAAERARGRVEDWQERRFDRRYGIETTGTAPNSGPLRNGYEPVTPARFRAMIRAARIAPRQSTFIDFGCGKGRALVLAAELGFPCIVGIEIEPALHEAARRNMLAFRRAFGHAGEIHLVLGDATLFKPPAHDNVVLFFYNPFGEALMARALATIEAACREAPHRRRIVVYRNPVHATLFDRSPCFVRRQLNRSYAIYQSCAARADDRSEKESLWRGPLRIGGGGGNRTRVRKP